MKNNLEIEFKTLVSKKDFQALLDHYPKAIPIDQTNTYFDIPDHSLAKRKIVVRIRTIQGISEFTMKVPSEMGLQEYSKHIEDINPESLNADDEIKKLLLAMEISSPLLIVGSLHTLRHLVNDDYGELCLDENTYGDTVDYELEYESTSDPHLALARFKQILSSLKIEYIPNKNSKYVRCMGISKE